MNEPFVKIDLHWMRQEEARKVIDKAIAAAGPGTYHLQLIHGFHRGEHGRPMEESLQYFYDKLLLLKDLMNTETGRKLAQERHEYLELYLEEYGKETQ